MSALAKKRMARAEPPPALAQRVAWLGLAFRAPEDWEIVRHGTRPERGELVFVDRRRERLRLSWTACLKPPDLSRLLEDFRKAEDGELASEPWRRADGVRGFSCATADGWLARAVRYDASGQRLLELALSAGSAEQANALLHALLDTLTVGGERFELAAFGLELVGPGPLVLTKADVRPMAARVELSLGGARVTAQRLGAAESWFSGDLRGWLARAEPASNYHDFESLDVHGHAALRVRGRERGPVLQRALGRLPLLEARVWHCPSNNALYALSAATKPGFAFELATLELGCCGGRAGDPEGER